MQVIDDLIKENQGKLDMLLDVYLSGDIDKSMLVNRKNQLEDTIRALGKERCEMFQVPFNCVPTAARNWTANSRASCLGFPAHLPRIARQR